MGLKIYFVIVRTSKVFISLCRDVYIYILGRMGFSFQRKSTHVDIDLFFEAKCHYHLSFLLCVHKHKNPNKIARTSRMRLIRDKKKEKSKKKQSKSNVLQNQEMNSQRVPMIKRKRFSVKCVGCRRCLNKKNDVFSMCICKGSTKFIK